MNSSAGPNRGFVRPGPFPNANLFVVTCFLRVFGVFASFALPAHAELIDFEFTGRITTSSIASNVLGDVTTSYEPGTVVSGTFSINDGATDSVPGGAVDQFSVDSTTATDDNLPGARWRIELDSRPPNVVLPNEFFSGPFSTDFTPLFLNQPIIDVRLEDSATGDEFSFSQSSRGGGTQLPFDSLSLNFSDPTGTAFPGSNSLDDSLAQLNTLLADGLDPFTQATGSFTYSRTPRLSRTRVEAQFEITSIRIVSTPSEDSPIELISQRIDGQAGGNGTSWDPSLSADAQMVAFSSDATDLNVENANGDIRDIFVLNRATGVLTNLTSDGNGISQDPKLSADGEWLAFRTQASNLPTNVPDTNGAVEDIVLADLVTGELILVTAGANGPSNNPTISGDGSHLAFDSLATNLAAGNYQPFGCDPTDANAGPCYKNILLYDSNSELTINLTEGGLTDSRAPALSEIGDHVAFNSEAFAPRSTLVFMDINTGERTEVGDFPLTIDASFPYLSANARWLTVLHTPQTPRTVLLPSVYLYDLEDDQGYLLDNTTRLTGDFSGDERFLFLSSESTELDPPDANGNVRDIFRLDLGTAPWGESGPPPESFERVTNGGLEDSGGPSTNSDGSIFVWDSTASNFANDNNGDNFDVFLLDLNAASDTGENRTPTANPQSVTVASGEDLDIVLQGFDADGDILEFVVSQQPANGTLNGTPPELTYTSDPGYSGQDSFSFTTNDGGDDGQSEPATVSISVTPVNNPPVSTGNTEFTTDEDKAVAISLTGSDEDGDPLTFEVTSNPTNGTLSGNAPELSYVPEDNFHGQDNFSFTVSDDETTSDPITVNITVLPINDVPVAESQFVTTPANTPVVLRLAGNDDDEQPLVFAIVSFPINGTLSGTLPNLLYSPATTFAGTDTFSFTVADSDSTSEEATVLIEVEAPVVVPPTPPPENSAPVAASLSVSTTLETAVVIVLGASDAENDPLSFSIESVPANGSLSGEIPNLVYTPDDAFSGRDSFSYTASDAENSSRVATVSIAVVDPSISLLSAVLPASRSVEVGATATAFATLINASSTDAVECELHLPDTITAEFFYQSTDSETNEVSGEPNLPVTVPAGTAQSFLFGITPTESMPAQEVAMQFSCANTSNAASIVGLNTFLLSASMEPAADLIALVATITDNGVMELVNDNGFLTAATINVGLPAQISVSADTGAVILPITLNLCQTDPATSICINPVEAGPEPVTVDINEGESPTFAVFASSAESIALDPANSRVFLKFHDQDGQIRGATSVAVENSQ